MDAEQPRSDATQNNAEPKAKKPGGVTGKGFVKGDKRINRGGRPKNFDMFRHLAQTMACEVITSADGAVSMSRVQMILHDWMSSKDPRKQLAFIEYAYGRVPSPVELTGASGGPVRFVIDIGADELDQNIDPDSQGDAGTAGILE